MRHLQTPSSEHQEFDELCQGVDEFQPLPELIARRIAPEDHERGQDAAGGTLDPLILAGLVSPV